MDVVDPDYVQSEATAGGTTTDDEPEPGASEESSGDTDRDDDDDEPWLDVELVVRELLVQHARPLPTDTHPAFRVAGLQAYSLAGVDRLHGALYFRKTDVTSRLWAGAKNFIEVLRRRKHSGDMFQEHFHHALVKYILKQKAQKGQITCQSFYRVSSLDLYLRHDITVDKHGAPRARFRSSAIAQVVGDHFNCFVSRREADEKREAIQELLPQDRGTGLGLLTGFEKLEQEQVERLVLGYFRAHPPTARFQRDLAAMDVQNKDGERSPPPMTPPVRKKNKSRHAT